MRQLYSVHIFLQQVPRELLCGYHFHEMHIRRLKPIGSIHTFWVQHALQPIVQILLLLGLLRVWFWTSSFHKRWYSSLVTFWLVVLIPILGTSFSPRAPTSVWQYRYCWRLWLIFHEQTLCCSSASFLRTLYPPLSRTDPQTGRLYVHSQWIYWTDKKGPMLPSYKLVA